MAYLNLSTSISSGVPISFKMVSMCDTFEGENKRENEEERD